VGGVIVNALSSFGLPAGGCKAKLPRNDGQSIFRKTASRAHTRTHFITFANENYKRAKHRLLYEARCTGWFHSVTGYGPSDLKWPFRQHFEAILKQKRGGGYWIWKLPIFEQSLERMDDGDFLVYLDSGCEINAQGYKRFQEYLV
jgi:hypothetical protein